MRISDWSSDVCSSDLLPIGSLDIEDVSIRFSGDHCGHAEGRVRAHVAGQVAGLNLSQGLCGFATCDGETVLLPLVSQSGMEKMPERRWLSGRYTAELGVEQADPELETARGAEGFAQVGAVPML